MTDISKLKGVGDKTRLQLAQIGIKTIESLLENYPKRYHDYTEVSSINSIMPGQVTVKGLFSNIKHRYASRGLHITEARLSDQTGTVHVTWFNQPYRHSSLKPSQTYYVSGVYNFSGQHLVIVNPDIHEDKGEQTCLIKPIYRQSKNLKTHQIHRLIKTAISEAVIEDEFPEFIVNQEWFKPLSEIYKLLHTPTRKKDILVAKRLLAYRELFLLMLASRLLAESNNLSLAPSLRNDLSVDDIEAHLDFSLTDDQRRTIKSIFDDLQSQHAMNLLVEGDTGSGKTLIATAAMAKTVSCGYQAALMAPTAILARQHYLTVRSVIKKILPEAKVSLVLGGSNKSKTTSKSDIYVGTHALFHQPIDLGKLGLVVVDEQHRFGVDQRQKLIKASQINPHVLSMTATPIPRTLALVVYGDLSLQQIKQKPAGRVPQITKIVPLNQRDQKLAELVLTANKNRKLFLVVPAIESSLISESIESISEWLSKKFPDLRYGVVHGRQKEEDRQNQMLEFRDGSINVLLATTVIEVGVDIPTATDIAIFNPERFGLAQVHQLRGRVGRNNTQGYCHLLSSDNNRPGKRLRLLESTSDGFVLADQDLKLRGPGAIYGVRQSGLLDLRMVDLQDKSLINRVSQDVKQFIKEDSVENYSLFKNKIKNLQKLSRLN